MIRMAPKKRKKRKGFGLQLEKARLTRGLTQTEAAVLLGVQRGAWARWEAGDRKPTGPALILLQQFIDGRI